MNYPTTLSYTKDSRSLYEIERSLIKKYKKRIWSPFMKSIREYKLINKGDKIAVAISGGKDSLILAKLLQELEAHNDQDFQLEYIAMDPGYNKENRERLEENCTYLGLPLKVFETDVFAVSEKIAKNNPCYMCARMRRGALYAQAQKLGCNKLALGHHFDDVIETTMMNILNAGNFKTMLPKLKADNFENMEIIRPLYHVHEEWIIKWRNYTGLKPLDCACEVAADETGSARAMVKKLIKELKEENPVVDMNIFRSAENVNVDMVLAYQKDGQKYWFLDEY